MTQVPRTRRRAKSCDAEQFTTLLVYWINAELRPADAPREAVIATAAQTQAQRDLDLLAALARLSRVATEDLPRARMILRAFFHMLIRTKTLIPEMPIESRARGRPSEWAEGSLRTLDDLVAGVKGKERDHLTGDKIRSNEDAIIFLFHMLARSNNRPPLRRTKLAQKAKTWANRLSSYRKTTRAKRKNPGNCTQ